MISYVPTDGPQTAPQGAPAGPPPEMQGPPPEMQGGPEMQGPPPEMAPEMPAEEPQEPQMDERVAYLLAMAEAEKIVGQNDPAEWAKAFKKFLQANLVKLPGRQNITVGG